MTNYFDKLIKIKFYIFCYPSHGDMKNNVILGDVDFFWNPLDIINLYFITGAVTIKWTKKHVKRLPKLYKNYNFVRYIFVVPL
jgi:hypothetical protein